MSIAVRNAYQLIDGLLEQGLDFVASYLEKSIKRPLIIVDHNGLIHYPNLPVNAAGIDNVFIQPPSNLAVNEYAYQENDKCLYFPIECNGSSVYVIVKNLPKNRLGSSLDTLHEAKLAIKCYFSSLSKADKNKLSFEQKLAEYLLSPNPADIADIIKLSEQDLDIAVPYYVSIIEADDADLVLDWHEIYTYSRNYLKQTRPDAIPLGCSNSLLLVIPACNFNDSLEPELNLPVLIKYKETLENRFKLVLSQGIGQSHTLLDLKKSYHEARIALTLTRLMGTKGFDQLFSALGVCSLIFSQEVKVLRSYCYKTLGVLMDYDKNKHGDLLVTLRQLLDNSFNWKTTADSLFIHINTLYYRINKIENLLHVDLSRMDTRVNLYTAIKIWDTLKCNRLWE